MTRTTLAAACVASVLVLAGCGGNDTKPTTAGTPTLAPSSAPVSTPPPAPTSSAPNAAAVEQAFVLEVMGKMPALGLARDELVKSGHVTCQAFRDKPGKVADLVKNATAAGATKDEVETARVIAIAAIHNLCTDQAGDL